MPSSPSRLRPLWLVVAVFALSVSLAAVPVSAQPVDPGPGQRPAALDPLDPQEVVFQKDMTWDDYVPLPDVDWEDRSLEPTDGTFKGALVLADFPDRDFFITQPQGATVFGNPQAASDIPREQVPQFYEDLLNTPSELNSGRTTHGYWMENSGGRRGVDLEAFGPYRMPHPSYVYFSTGFGNSCPTGLQCMNFQNALRQAWVADVGEDVADSFDFVFNVSAGQDHNSSWQEFGIKRWANPEDIPDEFGPPQELRDIDPSIGNWRSTRYVDWTSWAAATNLWPSAGGGRSQQAESTGMGVYAHEFGHIFPGVSIRDNYTNPYGDSRQYAGHYDVMSRGHDVGPGGVHTRWHVPSVQGTSGPGPLMLRNKMKLGLIDADDVLELSREALAETGVVVARVQARQVQPRGDALAGINVAMESGDHSPPCTLEQDWRCDRGGFDNYTVEVVGKMGADSFQTDEGVLLAKTKDADQAPFVWAIDANPQDIDTVDYIAPDGTPEMIPQGDARQLSDALFHAGTDSGSAYEYVDEANRLHFYVLDLERDADGVLSYTVAIRSLDGSGPGQRGAAVAAGRTSSARPGSIAQCTFPLSNTGAPGGADGHPDDVGAFTAADVYRLRAEADGAGWSTWLPTEVVAAGVDGTVDVPVYAVRSPGGQARDVEVTLTATSESDPSVSVSATCEVGIRQTTRAADVRDGRGRP